MKIIDYGGIRDIWFCRNYKNSTKIQRLLKRFWQVFKNQLTDSDKYQIENIEKKNQKYHGYLFYFLKMKEYWFKFIYCHLKYWEVISLKN